MSDTQSTDRILVVDDEPDILSVLVYHLSRAGFRVSTAVDGRGALAAIAKDLPDLIILDLMLPGIDGYEVLKVLREGEDRGAETPVILLTALKDEEERVQGFEYGADDYVTKPFSVRELKLRIKAILKRSRSDGPTEETVIFGSLTIDNPGHRCRRVRCPAAEPHLQSTAVITRMRHHRQYRRMHHRRGPSKRNLGPDHRCRSCIRRPHR